MEKKLYPVLLVCIFFNASVFAQSGRYKYFDIEIASKELIKSIGKDAEGYIWLATDQGVLRFDGDETQHFYKEFPVPYTKMFLRTQTGKFFVLYDSGLKEIISDPHGVGFRPFSAGGHDLDQALSFPKSIYEDQEGNIWIGEFNSLVRINKNGMKRFVLGEAFQSINYHRSFSFAEDAFGSLWIAPYKGKLLTYDREKDTLSAAVVSVGLTNVSAIVAFRGDYLFIGGREGIVKMRVDSDKNIKRVDFFDQVEDISTAVGVDDRYLYLGTWTNGLYRMDFVASTFERLEQLPFNDILDFEFDRYKKELWICGSENTGLFRESPFVAIKNVGETRIESISTGTKGTIYYSVGQQVFRLRQQGDDYLVEEILSSKDTYFDRILADGELLWIGDAFGSISFYNMKTKTSRVFQGNSGFAIQHICRDSRGSKWFAGNANALLRIDSGMRLKSYPVRNSSVVRESANGTLIAATSGGDTLLFRYDREEDIFKPLELVLTFETVEGVQVEDIEFDNDLNLYLATDAGLLKAAYENGSYRKMERIALDGFDENEPARAVAVYDKSTWVATYSGLTVLAGGSTAVFSVESGLPSKILKDRGLIIDPENNLFVATAKGLAKINASATSFRKTDRPVFKSLSVNGERFNIPAEGKPRFPYYTRLQADFIALSHPGTDLVYQTRIVGMDDRWSRPSANHTISVLGFSEGEYTLEVRARSGGNDWSEPLSFSFVVLHPWFRTWWAYLLFAFALAVFTIVSIKINNQHLIRQKRKLQQIIEARTEEINRQKNEIIEQKNKIIQQKEELLEKNRAVYESQKALSEADLKYLHLKEKQLQDQIEFKNKQITTHTLNIIQKNTSLKELRHRLEEIAKSQNGIVNHELRKSLRIIDESFRLDQDWEEFKLYFEQVYTGFYARLKVNYPDLTTLELRHCALIRLNLNISECASILGISHDSIKVSRTRLRKKLNIKNNGSLSDFILSM